MSSLPKALLNRDDLSEAVPAALGSLPSHSEECSSNQGASGSPDTPKALGPTAERCAALLDITGEVCPMTYVRTKLKLEELSPGDLLEVSLRGEEAVRNVPRSAIEEGHAVVSLDPLSDGGWKLLLRKNDRGNDANR